jgi:exodeoxyribonuclease VII small subunit
MNDATQPQAIMFEPTDDLELRAGRGEADGGEPSQGGSSDGRASQGKASEGKASEGKASPESTEVPEQITFERGYEELKLIVTRLDDPELPVHEMFEGFRRGKGLEKALRAYLQEREGELTELEEGNHLPEFEIAAPSNGRDVAAS